MSKNRNSRAFRKQVRRSRSLNLGNADDLYLVFSETEDGISGQVASRSELASAMNEVAHNLDLVPEGALLDNPMQQAHIENGLRGSSDNCTYLSTLDVPILKKDIQVYGDHDMLWTSIILTYKISKNKYFRIATKR